MYHPWTVWTCLCLFSLCHWGKAMWFATLQYFQTMESNLWKHKNLKALPLPPTAAWVVPFPLFCWNKFHICSHFSFSGLLSLSYQIPFYPLNLMEWPCYIILALVCQRIVQTRLSINSFWFWFCICLREEVKYYFADFVRKGGGGGTPQIRNSFFAEDFVRKGGRGGTP